MAHYSHRHSVAIACGGTGGHLFPGLAIAEKLAQRGSKITLIISQKEVDQQAVKQASDCQILALPAIGFAGGKIFSFLRGFRQSYLISRRLFRHHTPDAVIAMGGFTSAAPVLAGRAIGARTFLHESNAIPGRANRWLSWFVDQAFVGFAAAGTRLHRCPVKVSGTPVRHQFHERDKGSCRAALGLDPGRPTVLIVGGSQGACGINQIVTRCLPTFAQVHPEWQWFHLSGPKDAVQMRSAYAKLNLRAVVHGFFADMELALGAATMAISRAGASSLAEFAAMRVPAVLIPYPAARDNHQWFNAQAYATTGAAQVLEEKEATQKRTTALLQELMQDETLRCEMQNALRQWQRRNAASEISQHVLDVITASQRRSSSSRTWPSPVRSIVMETTEAPVGLNQRHAARPQEQPARI
jgi:UDP-N-acetylglucosamine--N-acetylmuramyl-(pentapeptide) pyrophosphoryl-undecaprenol N-acetylglucosamine transferase